MLGACGGIDTYAGRPRLRASFLSSLTVSFSHALVRRTVETKERVLEVDACLS